MSKHTPGPWSVYDRGIGFEVVTEDGETVNQGFRGTFGEEDANLIAAAPDLLEAAKLVYDCAFLDSRCTEDQWNKAVEAIETAIAKADGVNPASTEPDLAGGNA